MSPGTAVVPFVGSPTIGPVLIKVCSLVGRHRAVVLVLALALATGLGFLRETADWADRGLIFLTGMVILVGVLSLALVALHGYRPATLEIRPGATGFQNPPYAGHVLLAGAVTVQSGTIIVNLLIDAVQRPDVRVLNVSFGVAWAVFLAVVWWMTYQARGIEVRPDGIEDRQPFGTYVVPWEAFAGVEHPAFAHGRAKVALTVADPGLIRRGGWRPQPGVLHLAAIDSRFVAHLINEYATRPELRAAIGTPDELARLTTEWKNQP